MRPTRGAKFVPHVRRMIPRNCPRVFQKGGPKVRLQCFLVAFDVKRYNEDGTIGPPPSSSLLSSGARES